ncbi:hypothetical protein [Paenibacillus sp. FSL L8-0158]|uniref:hypothetical protein n=1 Tax=Paenibacillus sp. FSL L8-0158 TaxID=2954752 RepID=UPI00315956B2
MACERFGAIDVLVSNAGVMPFSPLGDLRVDDWLIGAIKKNINSFLIDRSP